MIYPKRFCWLLLICLVVFSFRETMAKKKIVPYKNETKVSTATINATHQLAIDFVAALKNDKVADLNKHIIGVKKMIGIMKWPKNKASRKKMKSLRTEQILALQANFITLRLQATSKGVNWEQVSFVDYETNPNKLHNLRIMFKDDAEVYWVELETIGNPNEQVLYMGEHLKSQFDEYESSSMYKRDRYVLLENFTPYKTTKNNVYYEQIAAKQALNTEIAEGEAVVAFNQLVQTGQGLLDSLLQEVNEMPLGESKAPLVNKLMLEQNHAAELRTYFGSLNEFVLANFTEPQIAAGNLNLIDVEIENWTTYIFKDLPPIACKMLLNKWQNDLEQFEKKVLLMWLEEF